MDAFCDMKTREVIPMDEAFAYAVEKVLHGTPEELRKYIWEAFICDYIMEESLQEMRDFIETDQEGFIEFFYSGNYFLTEID